MKISQMYPSTGYCPESQHYAFSFSAFFEIASFEDADDTLLPDQERIKRFEQFMNNIESIFPSAKTIAAPFPWDQWPDCKKFTGLEHKVRYNAGDSAVNIDSDSMIYAPSLRMQVKDAFFETQLHNCANPNLAIAMYFHGLSAIKTIYPVYGLDTSFVPSIRFEDKDLFFEVPYTLPPIRKRNSRLRDNLVAYASRLPHNCDIFPETDHYGFVNMGNEGFEMEQKDESSGRFVGRVSYKKNDIVDRSSIGVHLFNMASMQANVMYSMKDYSD